MAKILVTGGLGFIGSNLVRELRGRGHDVWFCDLTHSHDPKSIRCDVSKYRQVERLFEQQDFEYVYHLAAEYGRWNGEDYYENLWLTNVVGTKNLIRMQEKKKFKMIFFSSAEIYGDYDGIMSEDVPEKIHIHLLNDYAMTKWVGEMMIKNSAMQYSTETVIVRPFNVYGPGEVPGKYRNVIPNFIWWAMHGQPLPITGTGEETRDFTFVKDIVDGTLRMGVVEEAVGEAINLASETETRVIDLANWINEMTGNKAGIVFRQRRDWDKAVRRRASIEKARKILGYEPKTDMKTGLRKVYEWMKENYENIKQSVKF